MAAEQVSTAPRLAEVANPGWKSLVASTTIVVLGPLFVMLVVTAPWFAVGAIAGLLARPLLRAGRTVLRHVTDAVALDRVAIGGASPTTLRE